VQQQLKSGAGKKKRRSCLPSMSKSLVKLHIVAFDIPFPADYGGVIDIYYKLEALSQAGAEITLHMFHYGRKKQTRRLKKFCKEVYYYKRKTYKNPFMGSIPYIVNSRTSEKLLNNLLQDNNPILFEGLHTTYYLSNPLLKDRFKIVRTHNVEHHYYKRLEEAELSYFKKYFFRVEADKLKKYEAVLKHANLIAAISPKDQEYFSKKYNNVIYLPVFHSSAGEIKQRKTKNYVLYHGNLGVPENYLAAMELTKNVFSQLDVSCVVAGNNAPKELRKLVDRYTNVELLEDVSTEQLHQMIGEAQVNVLYTNQSTGIKLKLINALYRGKHIVVNPTMVEGTNLDQACTVAKDFTSIVQKIKEKLATKYTEDQRKARLDYLHRNFNNLQSAHEFLAIIPDKTEDSSPQKEKQKKYLSQISSFLSYFSL
jgi:hypothetical protein